MARVNIVKEVKENGRWKLLSNPRKPDGRYEWKTLPEGRNLIEWYEKADASGRLLDEPFPRH